MDEQLVALYHRHVAAAFDRQMRLSDFLGREAPGADWHYDVPTATLTFARVRFDAPLLGSQAAGDGSWLWAWGNRHLNLSAGNRDLAAAVRGLADRTGAAGLSADHVGCRDVLGPDLAGSADHAFAIVVSGELGYDAYYTMPYATGRMAVVIRDARLRAAEPDPLPRIATHFPQLLGSYPVVDHRAAFRGYLDWYGLAHRDDGPAVSVTGGGAEVMRAEFDDLGRMTELTGTFHGRG